MALSEDERESERERERERIRVKKTASLCLQHFTSTSDIHEKITWKVKSQRQRKAHNLQKVSQINSYSVKYHHLLKASQRLR